MKTITGSGEIDSFLGIRVPENIGEILHHAGRGRRGVDSIHSLWIPEGDVGIEKATEKGLVQFNPFEVSWMKIVHILEIIGPHSEPLEQTIGAFQINALNCGYVATADIAPEAAAA